MHNYPVKDAAGTTIGVISFEDDSVAEAAKNGTTFHLGISWIVPNTEHIAFVIEED